MAREIAVLAAMVAGFCLIVYGQHLKPSTSGRRGRRSRPGLAVRAHVAEHSGHKRLNRQASQLRPSNTHTGPADVGHHIGASRRRAVWTSVEDSTIVLGPPRAGKGLHLVIPRILDHRGPVITTSTRPDNLAVTMAARAEIGPVAVFDPQRLAPGVPSATRWSPSRGCERPQTAIARAGALVPEAANSTGNDAFWRDGARDVVRCLLHAAALANKPTADLYRWSLAADQAIPAIAILQAWDADLPATALGAVVKGDAKIRDGTWGVVKNTFACLADPDILHAVSPADGEQFDPAGFLASSGAVYLIGTAGRTAAGGLVAAFVEDVVDAARRRAATLPGSRLDPPLGLILDEAGNYPLDSLPSLMADGGGTGIASMVVLQSLAQARAQWRPDRAQAIWDAATVKIVLGGGSDADDLADLSKLLGEVEVPETSRTSRQGGGAETTSMRRRPVMTASQLRTLPPGEAVLILRTADPIHLTLTPWTARPDADRLQAAKTAVEDTIRAAAACPASQGRKVHTAPVPVPAARRPVPAAPKPGQLALGLDTIDGGR